MILNFLILAFVLFMAYWWGSQGVFSAVLHTAAVVIAGSLAFATWEPLTYSLFMKVNVANAWGIGLLLPFVIYLQIFRLSYDKFIKANVYFSTMANMIAGGVFGFFSSMLTAGIVVIGIGYMSLGPNILGYQPFLLGPDGHVAQQAGGNLWIPVDTAAANFFSKLSGGSFRNNTPLKNYMPDLVQQSGAFRMHVDGNATLIAKPGSVVITNVYSAKTPFSATDNTLTQAIGNDIRKGNSRVLIVDTQWLFAKPPYNGIDSTLRVSPTQIQLILASKTDPLAPTKLYQPIGASKLNEDGTRSFIPFKDAQNMIAGTNPKEDIIAFLFVFPDSLEPVDLFIRRLRMQLPAIEDSSVSKDQTLMASILGKLHESQLEKFQTTVANNTEGHVGNRQGITSSSLAIEIALSNELPKGFSKNRHTGPMQLGKDNLIMTINAESTLSNDRLNEANTVKAFYVPSHKAMVRVQVDREAAQSLLGRSVATAAMVTSQVTLVDDKGNRWFPSGYALLTKGKLRMLKDPDHPLKVAKQLPIANLREGEKLYVYFEVDRNRQIIRYELGHAHQEVRLTIPK